MKKKVLLALLTLIVFCILTACQQENPSPELFFLRVNVVGQGEVYPTASTFPANHLVTFTIQAKSGWNFSHWEGYNCQDVTFNQGSWVIIMNGHKELQAIFKKEKEGEDPSEPILKHKLKIQIEGQGNVYPEGGFFETGKVLELVVQAEESWDFNSWQGKNGHEVMDNDPNYAIYMNGDKELKAIFTQRKYSLQIEILGQGQVEERLLNNDYPAGSRIRLWAKASEGWAFKEWRNDIQGEVELVHLDLNEDKFVTAVFEEIKEIKYYLTLEVQGQGKVLKRPDYDFYSPAEEVTITAIANSGWEFLGWEGDYRGIDEQIKIRMDGDKKIIASFVELDEDKFYQLKVNVSGNGEVSINPLKREYAQGEKVSLKALADPAWKFLEWQGDLEGFEEQETMVMDGNKEVLAVFVKEGGKHKLTIKVIGEGVVDKLPKEDEYEDGSQVRLLALAETGWIFKGWTGDENEETNPLHVTMDRDKTITANFGKISRSCKLTVIIEPAHGGLVRIAPDKEEYELGEEVFLYAVAEKGFNFNRWDGDEGLEISNPLKIYMNLDKTIKAYFRPVT